MRTKTFPLCALGDGHQRSVYEERAECEGKPGRLLQLLCYELASLGLITSCAQEAHHGKPCIYQLRRWPVKLESICNVPRTSKTGDLGRNTWSATNQGEADSTPGNNAAHFSKFNCLPNRGTLYDLRNGC